MTEKKSFVLYHDIRKPLERLTDEERGKLLLAIFDYSQFGVNPELSGEAEMAFLFIQQSLDRDAEKWAQTREKRAAAGKSGGLATQRNGRTAKQNEANQANACFAKQNEANQAVSVPVSVSVSGSVIGGVGEDKPPRTKKKFTPPSVDEVRAYCQECGSTIDPEQFVDFYTANGWKAGKNPMRDWKATVRNWERREKTQERKPAEPMQFGWKED